VHRRYHHNELTFRMVYAFNENFKLPLSHDEVVHGKGSLLGKMPGDDWQRFANLRLLLSYMWAQPGKKLLFMGGELAQWSEWNHESSLEWHLLDDERHRGVQQLVAHLNRLYRGEPALHELDCDPAGFLWIDGGNADQSVLAFARLARDRHPALWSFNFTPVPRTNFRFGVPRDGFWRELANSDAREYGGSGHGNMGGVEAAPIPSHGQPYSVTVTLPPLGAVLLSPEAS
jgi:1,4-alpha-glucan branching enzyme